MDYKNILTLIYQSKNPEKVGKINDLLVKYKGAEQKLLQAVYEKYNLSTSEIEQLENGINPFEKEDKKPDIEKEKPHKSKDKKPIPKKYLYILFAVIVVVVLAVVLMPGKQTESTSKKEDKSQKEQIDQTKEKKSEKYYLTFEGMLGNIGTILMSLKIDKNEVVGYYVFKSQGERINLKGTKKKNKIVLNELDENNAINAKFEGVYKNHTFQGNWIKNDINYDFSLNCIYNNSKNPKSNDGADALLHAWYGKYYLPNTNYDDGYDLEIVFTEFSNGRIKGYQNDEEDTGLPFFGFYKIVDTSGVVINPEDFHVGYKIFLFQYGNYRVLGWYDLEYVYGYEYIAINGKWQKYNSSHTLEVNLGSRAPGDYGEFW